MQTALILGASRGIGLELVRQYVAEDWRVIATARDDAGLAQLKSLGAQTLRVDVANPISVSGLDWMLDGEKLDVALYVAGVMDPASIDNAPTQQAFDRVMHTNVMGAMQVIPQLAEALADGARLAVISSRMASMGLRTSPAGWLYRASKAALNSVLKDVSLALAGRAICVALSTDELTRCEAGRRRSHAAGRLTCRERVAALPGAVHPGRHAAAPLGAPAAPIESRIALAPCGASARTAAANFASRTSTPWSSPRLAARASLSSVREVPIVVPESARTICSVAVPMPQPSVTGSPRAATVCADRLRLVYPIQRWMRHRIR